MLSLATIGPLDEVLVLRITFELIWRPLKLSMVAGLSVAVLCFSALARWPQKRVSVANLNHRFGVAIVMDGQLLLVPTLSRLLRTLTLLMTGKMK